NLHTAQLFIPVGLHLISPFVSKKRRTDLSLFRFLLRRVEQTTAMDETLA
uniref:Uncharacterized protein n=1 Tax=Aegilops tauschii subsp. strangulata TaxID=200361 RepID=A0A453F078_AEGTS